MSRVDVVVVGSGVAGLSFALKLAERGSVAIVTKKRRADSNTNYAQGGIAAVMAGDDELDLHARDTFSAGAGLCHGAAVWTLVREGPARVKDLIDWGVRFSQEQATLALGREGGHSRRRIVHAVDRTGREIERALLDALSAHPSVTMLEDHVAVDLLVGVDGRTGERRCSGVVVLDRHGRQLQHFEARHTLLATGGLGALYRHTTNPDIATGDGVAMAYRAGARVGNLEFVQFHPTALYPAEGRAVLISEVVRGEGAVLLKHDGTPLMTSHPLGSLATRDIVARRIDEHLKESGAPYALLDLSPIPPEVIERRFPNILEECAALGLDMLHDPVPVVPAAHYECGGIATDSQGRTTLPGLLAVGETAFTGVHGANRLASNSLLEAVVYAHRAAEWVALELSRAGDEATLDTRPGMGEPAITAEHRAGAADAGIDASAGGTEALREEVRSLMWRDVAIVRSDERLGRAEEGLLTLEHRVMSLWPAHARDPEVIELRNMVEAGLLVVRCARLRPESRGLHYNVDHPHRDNERLLRDTMLVRGGVA